MFTRSIFTSYSNFISQVSWSYSTEHNILKMDVKLQLIAYNICKVHYIHHVKVIDVARSD